MTGQESEKWKRRIVSLEKERAETAALLKVLIRLQSVVVTELTAVSSQGGAQRIDAAYRKMQESAQKVESSGKTS